MANYWEQLFSDIFDPGGIFHDTKSKKESDAQWLANYQLQQRALLDQEAAFQYQQQYDKWQQDFAYQNQKFSQDAFNRQQSFNEKSYAEQMAFQKDSFAQQMALAQSPVSTVVNDAAKVGVNPMAAMGMSAGSASAGSVSPTNGSYSDPNAPNSNARGSFGAGSLGQTGLLNSMISALGSVGSAHISANQSDKESKRNAALRQQELDIIREKNRNDFALGNRSADIAQQNANSQSTSVTGDLSIRERLASVDEKRFAHDEMMDYRRLLLDQSKLNRSIYESDRDYSRRVSEFNKEYDRLVEEYAGKIATADKDRRQRYITSFIESVSRVASSFLFISRGKF